MPHENDPALRTPGQATGTRSSVIAPLRRWRLLAAGGAALLLLASAGWITVDATSRARDIRTDVLRAEAELRRVQATVQSLAGLDGGHLPAAAEIEDALLAIRAAHEHLERARARLGYLEFGLPLVDPLPPAHGAGEVRPLIEVALTVTDSADHLLSAVLPLLQDAPGDDRSLAERVRAVFVEDGEALDAALAELESRRSEVARLREREWGQLLEAAPPALELLDEALGEVPRARHVLAAIREGIDPLFGFDRPRTYLVAGLNESEIRPTGGFMGTLGVITVERGHITSSEFERVYAFERTMDAYPVPPADLALTMGAGWWLLRDANWWPDFPTSAESTLELFEAHQGFRADGVIAINTLLTGRLVEVFEPLTLPEYPEALTADNWRGVMERTLLAGRGELGELPIHIEGGQAVPVGEAGGDGSAEEAYLHPLMEALIARSQSASADQLPALVAALHAGSGSRDLQAYVRDPSAQAVLDAFAVTGRLEAPTPEQVAAGEHVIAVVDSNVSWSKVQPGIYRDTLVLLGGDGFVEVTVRWHNQVEKLDPQVYPRAANFGAIYDPAVLRSTRHDGVFGNYVRLYLPAGIRDIRIAGAEGLKGISYEGGFTLVTALVIVSPGEDARLSVTYVADDPITALTVWKQGGQEHDRLRVLRNHHGTQLTLFEAPFLADVRLDIR